MSNILKAQIKSFLMQVYRFFRPNRQLEKCWNELEQSGFWGILPGQYNIYSPIYNSQKPNWVRKEFRPVRFLQIWIISTELKKPYSDKYRHGNH
jgi:hypothetical protein